MKTFFSKGRAKGPSERWAEVPENKALIQQHMDQTKAVGQGGRFAATRKALYDKLPQDEKDHWETLGPPEPSPEEERATMAANRRNLAPNFVELFTSLIGVGVHCVGPDAAFYVRWAVTEPSGEVDNKEMYVGPHPQGQNFQQYARGLMEELNIKWLGFIGDAFTQPKMGLEHGITYVNDRPMLPESRPEWNGLKMIEVLLIYFRATWLYAHRGAGDVPALSATMISEHLKSLEWPAPDLSQATGATLEQVYPLWIKIRSTQGTDDGFTFIRKDAQMIANEATVASVQAPREDVNPANNARTMTDGRKVRRRPSTVRVVESTDEEDELDEDDDGMNSASVRLRSRAPSRLEGISDTDDETTSGAAAANDNASDETSANKATTDKAAANNDIVDKGTNGDAAADNDVGDAENVARNGVAPRARAKKRNNRRDEHSADEDTAVMADVPPLKKCKTTGGRGGKADGSENIVTETDRQPRIRKPTLKAVEAAGSTASRSSAGSSRSTRPKGHTSVASK
ncbi:uncharacterized protein C8Q71DRAFT_487354 [Rhodofomes roseus]|uniref:Uncharacterized protein n=1 Tax=Rhodofomes roseus TaxID=34475 RepID=A0ABQ8JX89_9APHY|nr:uncharacterized protein C8Q71DRAFT_487354 [Rhodofomes roseus]KAH9828697.1 hypothetical protein C8Q71DRAFT_487354 [Rhodofomes roseus]